MENQHSKDKGLPRINQDEIDLMNEIKVKGEELEMICDNLATSHVASGNHAIDLHWLDIMELVRSVAQTASF